MEEAQRTVIVELCFFFFFPLERRVLSCLVVDMFGVPQFDDSIALADSFLCFSFVIQIENLKAILEVEVCPTLSCLSILDRSFFVELQLRTWERYLYCLHLFVTYYEIFDFSALTIQPFGIDADKCPASATTALV